MRETATKTKLKNNQKGITLIALVITIIVLLILAGVAISMLSGDNGILKQAANASEKTKQASEIEVMELAYMEQKIVQETEGGFNDIELISKVGDILPDRIGKDYIESSQIGESLEVKTKNGLYLMDKNGKVTLSTEPTIPSEIASDSRYGNEEIKIDSAEKMYALGRILRSNELKNSLGYSAASDFKLFDFPAEANTTATKIAYLQTASYILEKDIEIDLSARCTNDESETKEFSYIGIGSYEQTIAFKGFFNGNNKTITLKSSNGIRIEHSTNSSICYTIGVFGLLTDATVFNLNIDAVEDLEITSTKNEYSFGLLAGKITNSNIYNITAKIDGVNVGIVQETMNDRKSFLGGLIGTANAGNSIEKCSVNLKNNGELTNIKTSTSTNDMYSGGIVGISTGGVEEENRNIYKDCNVNIDNSKIIANSGTKKCNVGGIVGESKYSRYINNGVYLNDSSIGASIDGDTVITVYSGNQQDYSSIAVGGIIGFARPGSDNTSNIGVEGNTIESCIFKSRSSVAGKEIIYAKEKGGLAPNVGGLVGIAFNNCTINNSTVDVENGVMIAERTASIEGQIAQYGTTAGGIIGRLEHTGRIYGCTVKGNNLKIISSSTEKDMYVGGIVGIDIGPCHKKQVTLENNTFIGNNTSEIILNVIKSGVENSGIYIGGIAGQSGYRMENCKISGAKLILNGEDITTASKVYMGKVLGVRYDGSWQNSCKFDNPDESGIFNTTQNNVTLQNNLTSTIEVNTDQFN